MSKVLIITLEAIGPNIAGPAIRYLEMVRYLARFHDVTLAIPDKTELRGDNFTVITYSVHLLKRLANAADVLIIQGMVLDKFSFLKDLLRPIAIDLYPYLLENLESGEVTGQNLTLHSRHLKGIIAQLKVGDFFICTHQRQRDFWLGMLCAAGRINPLTYRMDKKFENLLALVPFGLPSPGVQHTKKVLKGVHRGISEKDKVILWWGGIWEWYDPITLLQAMRIIRMKRDDIKLCFVGANHPNPLVLHKMSVSAFEMSKKLGLFDESVFFMNWVPYQERENYLAEADIGISIHQEHIESRFAFRTRVLDYIWANLPIIASDGDAMGELVRTRQLGIAVRPGDIDSLADSILELLDNTSFYDSCRKNLQDVSSMFRWDEVLKPLNEFCRNPRLAQDKALLGRLFRDLPLGLGQRSAGYYFQRLKAFYSKHRFRDKSFEFSYGEVKICGLKRKLISGFYRGK